MWFWSKGENHYFQICAQPYLRILKRQYVWAQHVFRTTAGWNVGILSASLRYWSHYKKSKTRQWCVHASREGTEVPREKRKTHGQRKKAAYTLSRHETTSKEVRQCHPVQHPIGTERKRSGFGVSISFGVSQAWCMILSLFICFKHEIT